MKNLFKILALVLTTAVITTACEERVLQTDPVENVAAINSNTFSVIPNESGSVQAFIGDEISAQGINLENVSSVEFYYSGTTATAEISYLDHNNISFIIPYFDMAQSDYPYSVTLNIYDKNIGDVDGDGETDTIYSSTFYISVPIIDVVIDETAPITPEAGTIGDELVITGRNLGQVYQITFAGTAITEDNFVSHQAESISFIIPEGTYDAGTSEVAISVTWNGGNVVSVTDAFAMKTPKFDAYVAPSVTPLLNEYIYLTGENLDLVNDYTWDGFSLSIYLAEGEEATSDKVTLYIPAVMDDSHDGVMTNDILAAYGTPSQAITAVTGVEIDATKLAIATPEITAIRAEDDGDNTDALRFYLGKTVTMTGVNMNGITAVTVDGQSATLVGTPTGIECQFIMPDTFDFDTFTTATELEIGVTYGDDSGSYELTEKPTVKVYPMYFYKDVCLGLGTTSSGSYTAYGHDNAFFMLNSGKVLTATEWRDQAIDPFALTGNNLIVTASNTINKSAADATMENYYSVEPYIMINSNSSGKVSIASASNSASVLKCHRYTSDYSSYTSLPSTYGTSILGFNNIRSSTDENLLAVQAGTLEEFNETESTNSAVPAMAADPSTSNSAWNEGSVMMVAYATYTYGAAKPNMATEARNVGYMYIKEITLADPSTGLTDSTNADHNGGYVKFDFYWSPIRNADE